MNKEKMERKVVLHDTLPYQIKINSINFRIFIMLRLDKNLNFSHTHIGRVHVFCSFLETFIENVSLFIFLS